MRRQLSFMCEAPMIAAVQLIVRDWLGEQRERGLGPLVLRLLSIGVLIALTVPSGVVFGRGLRLIRNEPSFANVSTALVLTSSVTWLIASWIFGARLCSDFDFRKLLPLPLSFRSLFAVRCVSGLSGRWLLFFAPPLVAVSWVGSATWAELARALAGVALWAIGMNQLVTIAAFRLRSFVRRGQSGFVLFIVFTIAAFAVLSGIRMGQAGIARAIARVLPAAQRVQVTGAARWLPPGVLGHGLSHGMPALDLLLLGGYTLIFGAGAHRALRAAYLNGPPAVAVMPARRASLIERVDRLSATSTSRDTRSTCALLAEELTTIGRIPNLRVLMLAATPYCSMFALFTARRDGFSAPYFLVLLALPFLMTVAFKSNLFGMDAKSNRTILLLPIPAAQILRIKLLAVNLIIAMLVASVALVVALANPRALSMADWLTALLFVACALVSTDMAGAVGSVLWPKAVKWGKAFPNGSSAGANCVFAALAALVAAAIAAAVVERMSHIPGFALAWSAIVFAVLVGVYAAPYRQWSRTAVTRHRDRLLAAAAGA